MRKIVECEEDPVEVVWRDTMEDGQVAVRGYSVYQREQPSEHLKDWKIDFDKIVSLNINPIVEQFTARAFVYHPGRNVYLQIKKYDEERKIYQVRVKEETSGNTKNEDQTAFEVRPEEISDQINVNVRLLTEEQQLTAQL